MIHAVYVHLSTLIYLSTKASTLRARLRARRTLLACFLSPGTFPAERRVYDDYYGKDGLR